jgi:hypothetical protein
VSGLSDEFCWGTSAFNTLSSPDKFAAVNYSDIKNKLNLVLKYFASHKCNLDKLEPQKIYLCILNALIRNLRLKLW